MTPEEYSFINDNWNAVVAVGLVSVFFIVMFVFTVVRAIGPSSEIKNVDGGELIHYTDESRSSVRELAKKNSVEFWQNDDSPSVGDLPRFDVWKEKTGCDFIPHTVSLEDYLRTVGIDDNPYADIRYLLNFTGENNG